MKSSVDRNLNPTFKQFILSLATNKYEACLNKQITFLEKNK